MFSCITIHGVCHEALGLRKGVQVCVCTLMLGANGRDTRDESSPCRPCASLGIDVGRFGVGRPAKPTVAIGLWDEDPLPDVALYEDVKFP